MEPEEFPRWLGDEYERDEAQEAELRRAFAEAQDLVDLFEHRGWRLMEDRLKDAEIADRVALENCEIDEVQRYRDRLGYWRWMLGQKELAKIEFENLRTRLEVYSEEGT